MNETFWERVERIRYEQNITITQAIKIATAEIQIERRRAVK